MPRGLRHPLSFLYHMLICSLRAGKSKAANPSEPVNRQNAGTA